MTRDEIQAEFARFIEFPPGSDGRFVTTASCLMFAEHIAGIQREQSRRRILAQDVDPSFKHRMAVAVGSP